MILYRIELLGVVNLRVHIVMVTRNEVGLGRGRCLQLVHLLKLF